MRRFASEPDQPSGLGELLREGLVLTGTALLRSPLVVGSATAFLVVQSFVTANAIWYQPHFHSGAFFETRSSAGTPPPARQEPEPARTPLPEAEPASWPVPEPAPRAAAEPSAPAASAPPTEPPSGTLAGDATVREVQRILAGLNLYDGDVDGLNGPQTRRAVEQYRGIVGLEPNSRIDEALLSQLGLSPDRQAALSGRDDGPTASIAPKPAPVPPGLAAADDVPDPRIVRIQAGLRAFGNEGLELDGVAGERTRAAIREFQSLFGMPETGEPDEAVYVKMREIGLTD